MQRENAAGIGMESVMGAHRVIENTQNVFIEFRFAPNVGRRPGDGYTVVCEVVAGSQVAQDKVGIAVYGQYPTHQHKTVEGLMLNLLYRIDHALDDVVAHRAERDAVRLPGF